MHNLDDKKAENFLLNVAMRLTHENTVHLLPSGGERGHSGEFEVGDCWKELELLHKILKKQITTHTAGHPRPRSFSLASPRDRTKPHFISHDPVPSGVSFSRVLPRTDNHFHRTPFPLLSGRVLGQKIGFSGTFPRKKSTPRDEHTRRFY